MHVINHVTVRGGSKASDLKSALYSFKDAHEFIIKVGRRKRRGVAKPLRKRLPKVFLCPVCGKQSVLVKITQGRQGRTASVNCGNCGVSDMIELLPIQRAVDAYCTFVDKFWK
ncbi:TPA: hypothetical protein EYP44_00610 [Candidatus Bathyarchaeota archaeon]|nr:hypothetical protein [Candidatus Bathyarchaeota archaeon]